MDLLPNGDEEQIIEAAASFLSNEMPVSRLHKPNAQTFTPDARTRLADLGWYSLGLAESLGGVGFTAVEEMLLFRELGRYLGPTGVLSITLAAKVAAGAGEQSLAESLTTGQRAAALAISEDLNPKMTGTTVSGRFRLFDIEGAGVAVLVHGDEGLVVDLSKVSVEALSPLDKSVSLGTAEFKNAPILARVTDPAIRRTGELATAAMLVGISEAVRDMIVEYAKIRQTFGRAIGSYQAVRHPCADMAVRCEVARCQLFVAAIAVRDGREDADVQLDAAKVIANSAAIKNVDWNTQLHGGIAVTDEHDAHLFLKRAHLLSRWFGSDKVLLDRLVDASLKH